MINLRKVIFFPAWMRSIRQTGMVLVYMNKTENWPQPHYNRDSEPLLQSTSLSQASTNILLNGCTNIPSHIPKKFNESLPRRVEAAVAVSCFRHCGLPKWLVTSGQTHNHSHLRFPDHWVGTNPMMAVWKLWTWTSNLKELSHWTCTNVSIEMKTQSQYLIQP